MEVKHCEGLIEMIETDISFSIFGVQNEKISVVERGSVKQA
jgi:hypothetical protein